ncbi:hypothetical protein JoomaDRAFT_3114 [Galbibacter orientalis DSM 19592]|uniref:Uncharacterized protein n=1 Tax=Galbibacter orientalis DSM 19592 TaxID=926559 RepID=I3C8X3_9FLAO|nr:hypothetical protein JoomaDRAFT_3114 [Galbibacter orientalis DSM 19592]
MLNFGTINKKVEIYKNQILQIKEIAFYILDENQEDSLRFFILKFTNPFPILSSSSSSFLASFLG